MKEVTIGCVHHENNEGQDIPRESREAATRAGEPHAQAQTRRSVQPCQPRSRHHRQRHHQCADRRAREHRVALRAGVRWRPGVLLAAIASVFGCRFFRRAAGKRGVDPSALRRQQCGAGHDTHREGRRAGRDHRFRAALQAARPHVPSDADSATRTPAVGLSAHRVAADAATAHASRK